MKKRNLSRMEAFKLVRKLKESKKAVKFLKVEDAQADETYAVVSPEGGDATVTFKNGEMLVGPFSSPEAAQAELGADVQLVTGDADDGAVSPVPDDLAGNPAGDDEVLLDDEGGDAMTEKQIKSNLLRMRKQVVESISKRVKADILRESEALDIETDAKAGDAAKEDGAGTLDNKGQIASFVNAADTGSTDTSIDADQSASAKNIDQNVMEARAGQLVNVFERGTMKKVDTGMVESSGKGQVKMSGGDSYDINTYTFQVLAQ
jgi:hypothetical protein